MKKIMVCVFICLALFSCKKKSNSADGVLRIQNTTKPQDAKFNYKFTEEFVIDYNDSTRSMGIKRVSDVCFDNAGNLYVADGLKANILKFDANYQFVKYFGGRGNGPGEFAGGPANIAFCLNKLMAPCYRTTETNVYDLDGNFLQKIPPKIRASFSGQDSFAGKIIMDTESRSISGDEVIFTNNVVVMDSSMSNILDTLYTRSAETKNQVLNIISLYTVYAVGEEMLYIAKNSTSDYRIYGFNKDFKKKIEISKSYRKFEITKEKHPVYQQMEGMGGGFVSKEKSKWKNKRIYYNAVNQMFVDKYQRLWVVSPEKNIGSKEGLFVDIFEKGKYLNTIKLPFHSGNVDFDSVYFDLVVEKDKVVYLDHINQRIVVYGYQEEK